MTKQIPRKEEKAFAKKQIKKLAADDYVDDAQTTDISESDIHKPFGATVRDSNAESREAKALRSWARREHENDEILRENLSSLTTQDLRINAELVGISGTEKKTKAQLIEDIVDAMHLG